MHPKFILISRPEEPLKGIFAYGLVANHRDLVEGYVKVHGGGWYEKDDDRKTMVLYGSSADYGEPVLSFLDRIPRNLEGYTFYWSPDWGKTRVEMDLSEVEWI